MAGMNNRHIIQMKPYTDATVFFLLRDIAMGFCLGTANIIPGVSGGTFLLIFNIYERVFTVLEHINPSNIIHVLNSAAKIICGPARQAHLKNLAQFFESKDFFFVLRLATGAVGAIFLLSGLMKYLLVHYFSPTYALFFGLILVSIIVPLRMMTQKKIYMILFFAFGVSATIWVSLAVNPYEKVKLKSEIYHARYIKEKKVQRTGGSPDRHSLISEYTADGYAYALVCGAVAVSAMILPGISGSLVLILMGEYFEIISAIAGLGTLRADYILFLGCFSVGLAAGGLLFARLVNELLKRFYNPVMAFLTGLMAGSLYALWPFKKSIIMAEQYIRHDGVIQVIDHARIYTNINQLPSGTDPQLYFSLAAFAAGCVIMCFFVRHGN